MKTERKILSEIMGIPEYRLNDDNGEYVTKSGALKAMEEYASQFPSPEKVIDWNKVHDDFIAWDTDGKFNYSQRQIFEWFKIKISDLCSGSQEKEQGEPTKDWHNIPLLTATIIKDGDQYCGNINEEKGCISQEDSQEKCKKSLLMLHWIKHDYEKTYKNEPTKDIPPEIIEKWAKEEYPERPDDLVADDINKWIRKAVIRTIEAMQSGEIARWAKENGT